MVSRWLVLFALVAGASVVGLGCSGDSDNTDAPDVVIPPGDTDEERPEDTVGPPQDVPPDTDAAGDTGGGDACEGPDGCWACEPESSVQILNRCTDASCEPFNNAERLPLLANPLPPLP